MTIEMDFEEQFRRVIAELSKGNAFEDVECSIHIAIRMAAISAKFSGQGIGMEIFRFVEKFTAMGK